MARSPRPYPIQRALRAAAVVVTVASYALVGPLGYLLLTLWCLAPTRSPRRRALALQTLSFWAYRFLHAWLRVFRIARFDPADVAFELPEGPFVLVANHQSSLDVTAIGATFGPLFTIITPRVFHKRTLTRFLVGHGHIEGPGADPVSLNRAVEASVAQLEAGMSLKIFPEGTRSRDGRLLPFGRLAFEIACRAQVPVLSVATRCEPLWLSKDVGFLDPPHPAPKVTLEVLAVDEPSSFGTDSRALRQRVEERFRAWSEGTRSASRPGSTVI